MSRRRLARPAVALLAGAALLGACGEDEPEPEPARTDISGVGTQIGGSVAPLAQCRDWNRGTHGQKLATIEDIRGQLTPQTSENEDSGLPDQEAYELFDRVCAQEYAAAFRLYKVYSQRAGFKPLAP